MYKPITQLSKHYKEHLDLLVRFGWNHSMTDGFCPSVITKIKPIYNRLSKNQAYQNIYNDGQNPFKTIGFITHILDGEILYDQDTFLWYLLDRYSNREQIDLYQVIEDNPSLKYHEEMIPMLNGLSVRYPELISFWPTNGLNVINLYK
jgi:hypothetical protein